MFYSIAVLIDPNYQVSEFDKFSEWSDGHSRHVYPPTLEEGRKHASGWAMRNTNNHNVNILKKSCLGVVLCNLRCTADSGNKVCLHCPLIHPVIKENSTSRHD